MTRLAGLTRSQKAYIWLAGSYPDRLLIQGRGYRSDRIKYRLEEEGELVVFGYSNPPLWLARRGLFRPGQAPGSYVLTDDGEAAFRRLVVSGAGAEINRSIREVRS